MMVKEMFKGIVIVFGNDVFVVMVEYIVGLEEDFVSWMNKKVKELGLKDIFFKNLIGLFEKGYYSFVYDMVKMVKELLKYDKII